MSLRATKAASVFQPAPLRLTTTVLIVFAGKDPSRALGMSSLKDEDCVPDISTLTPEQLETLDGWMSFFKQRYNQVGIIPEYHDSSKEGGTSSS